MPDVFLYQGEANPPDVVAADPTVLRGGPGTVTWSVAASLTGPPTSALQLAHGVAWTTSAQLPLPISALQVAHGVAWSTSATMPEAPTSALAEAHGVAWSVAAQSPDTPVSSIALSHGVAFSISALAEPPSSAIVMTTGASGPPVGTFGTLGVGR